MQLIKATITNFRGISDTITVNFGRLNVVVGQNDVGKSTLLKALHLFLAGGNPQPEHANVETNNSEVIVELFFDPEDANIVIDEAIETTFEQEELTNEEGLLQIRRCWDVSKSKPTAATSIVRKEYNQNDLLNLNENQLRQRCQEIGIQTQKANGVEYNNVEKRQKLREHYTTVGEGYEYKAEQLPTSGNSRLKKISNAVNKALPRFEYFRADTSLSETDTAIQNYFRDIAHQGIREHGINELQDQVERKLKDILSVITDKINRVVAQDDQVEPSVTFDWSKVVKTAFRTRNDQGEVPLDQRGDGFRRITMMAYFEHLAEQPTDAYMQRKIIFGFEEPETFLHPSTQEKLFERLSDLSDNNYQVVLSTHSPVLVARSRRENLIHVAREAGQFKITQNVQDVSDIARDLGITGDNQLIVDSAKVLLLVEGSDDINAMRHTAKIYKEAGVIPATFEEQDVAIIPLGGCDSIKHWVNLHVLRQLNKPFCMYLDSDKETADSESDNRNRLIELGFSEQTDFLVTRKRAIENYIPCSHLNSFISEASPHLLYGDWEHVKNICKNHPDAGTLGGKNVAEKHFTSLTLAYLQSTFNPTGNDDEFLQLYNMVIAKIS
jgi:predicted ATP-dependent endonuclease of OLD family